MGKGNNQKIKQVLEELENEVFHLERSFQEAMEVIQRRIEYKVNGKRK